MTAGERQALAHRRQSKRRIAAGCTKVEDCDRLLHQFEQMQKMMKQINGHGKQGQKLRQMMAR